MKSLWNRTAILLLSVMTLQIAAPIAPAAFAMEIRAEIGDQNPFSNPWAQDPDWVRNHVYQQVERYGYTPAVQQFIQNMQQVAQSPVTSSNPQDVKNYENLRDQIAKDSALLQKQLQQLSLPQPPKYLPDFKEQDLDSVTQSLWKSVGWDDSSTPPSGGLTRQTGNILDAPQGLTKIYETQARYLETGREDISDLIGSTINEKFVDINGLAKGLQYGIPFQGFLRSKITTQQGRDIREGLNTVLVADHVIQKGCQSDASNAALCGSYRQLSLELAAGYLVADRISGRQDQAPYQSLMESLARGTKLVGSFAKEVATGAVKLGAGAAVLALLPEELAAGAVALTVTAVAHEIGKALLDYPATADAIKKFVRDSKDTFLHGSAEEQGALLGKATVAVGGVLFGKQIGAAADATAVAARGIISDAVSLAVKREAVAAVADAAVARGVLDTVSSGGLKNFAKNEPDMGFDLAAAIDVAPNSLQEQAKTDVSNFLNELDSVETSESFESQLVRAVRADRGDLFGKSVVGRSYNGHMEIGVLPDDEYRFESRAFLGKVYWEVTPQPGEVFYRVGGPTGSWWSRDNVVSEMGGRIDKAILPDWNDFTQRSQITVPASGLGTWYEGIASPQGKGFLGGAGQLYIPKNVISSPEFQNLVKTQKF